MKRTVVILGVAAALVAAPSVASAGTSPGKPARAKSYAIPQKAAGIPAFGLALQSFYDDRSGATRYRLGNSGMWMQ